MLSSYQAYWWLIISVLGALLVFLLFVQGGQTILWHSAKQYKTLLVNSLGRKWEFTFTTLVVFGGAFFASFPLFYSTSFGGAYWLWMLILLSFVLQAVSYEFRRKKGNIYGTSAYDTFLAFNGLVGCVMLGVAVGTMFFGAEFTVARGNLVDGTSPVISQWTSTHGLEAMLSWRCLLLGFTVFFLARTQGAMYFINNVDGGAKLDMSLRVRTLVNGIIFAVLFVLFTIVLMLTTGLRQMPDGTFVAVDNIYWHNLLSCWWMPVMFVAGVVSVLYGIGRTALCKGYRSGIWWSGVGTVLVVMTLFFLAGYNDTAYLPSLLDAQSSLTIANSSSSLFTLRTMAVVSVLIPFVLAYIIYVWRKMNNSPLTNKELEEDSHIY